jgi:hypothetical protein
MNLPRDGAELIGTETTSLRTALSKLTSGDLGTFVDCLSQSSTLLGNVEAYKKLMEVLPPALTTITMISTIEKAIITEEIRHLGSEMRMFIFNANKPLVEKIVVEEGQKTGYCSTTISLIKAFEDAWGYPVEADMWLKYLLEKIDPWAEGRENLFFSTVLSQNLEYIQTLIKHHQSIGINIRSYLKKFEWEAFNWSTLPITKYLLEFLEEAERPTLLEKYQNRMIIQGVCSTHQTLIETIDILTLHGIAISSTLREARNHDDMAPLDVVCLNGRIEHTKTILQHMTPADLKHVLSRPNHGFRTTLGHCTYYKDSGCRELIVEAMKQVGLGDMINDVHTLRVIRLE